MDSLPAPEVIRCYFDEGFQPHLPAMCLRWDADSLGRAERLWYLPEDVCLEGPPPERFGINLQRLGTNAYAVRLLWNQSRLSWASLTRVQLLTSALGPILRALGTELRYLLDQPVKGTIGLARKAA
jgi:hypothetical protein